MLPMLVLALILVVFLVIITDSDVRTMSFDIQRQNVKLCYAMLFCLWLQKSYAYALAFFSYSGIGAFFSILESGQCSVAAVDR